MPGIADSIQQLFTDHQTRLDTATAASGTVGLALLLDQASAEFLKRKVEVLVRDKLAADAAKGSSPTERTTNLATSYSRLASQVRKIAPNDAFYSAFTAGAIAAAQDVFLAFF
jgi:hypothetical protein